MVNHVGLRPSPLTPSALLLTAAVARLAASEGVRLLVIKGLAATEYDLRHPRSSSDVDIMVAPDDFDVFVSALEDRGWTRRAHDPDTATFPLHSVSLFHPRWAEDVDVHFRYPGLERPGAEVFERLWSQRTTFWCGNQSILIPSLADSILIGAVHAIRSIWAESHRHELDYLVHRCRRMKAELLIARAREVGALATARPFLERLLPPRHDIVWGEPSAEWRLRTEFPESIDRRALLWKQATPRERLTKLRHALFPPVSALVKQTTQRRLRPTEFIAGYLARWARGLRVLPRGLVTLARASHSQRPEELSTRRSAAGRRQRSG
jgi:hypothetical protein